MSKSRVLYLLMALASTRSLSETSPELAVAAAALLRCAAADAKGRDPAEVVVFSEQEEACVHHLLRSAGGAAGAVGGGGEEGGEEAEGEGEVRRALQRRCLRSCFSTLCCGLRRQ